MNIKEKIKLYEKKIEDNKITGFKKKNNINASNNIRRKINDWNNIGKNEEIKIEKSEKKIEKKEEKNVDDEEELLNNYKYSNDSQDNIDITINNFIKLTESQPQLINMITEVKKNINLLPELMKDIKLYNHKLALNLMDNPGFCFEKIFDILFNKSDNIEEYLDSIQRILDIFPYYSKEEVFEIFKSSNYNVDLTIETICN